MQPKLLYLGDVPVESGVGASDQLYRLLQGYPEGRLRIIEGGHGPSVAGRRLAGTPYFHHAPGKMVARMQTTKLRQLAETWIALMIANYSGQIRAALEGFGMEAVLTSAHGHGWLAAASFAKKRRLPLHLLVPEDWPETTPMMPPLRPLCHRMFGDAYRQAASRWCVSPAMEMLCSERYGTAGTVLYPCRRVDGQEYDQLPEKGSGAGRALTVGYAGTLDNKGCVEVLRSVASAIMPLQGKLHIYGAVDKAEATRAGLDQRNVILKGPTPSLEFITRVRQETDVLVVPVSFEAIDADVARLSFPDVLADATAAALPLIIVAPEYSPALRWARENTGAAIGVTQPERNVIGQALQRLASDPHLRANMALNAARTGARMFGAEKVRGMFFEHLQKLASPKG